MVRRSAQGEVDSHGDREGAVSLGQRRIGGSRCVQYQGERYRLVAAIAFDKRIVWITWLGTHAQYDTIDVKTVACERPKADSK